MDPNTSFSVAIAAVIILWGIGVGILVVWLTFKIVPTLREVMENGTEEEKAAVRKAMHPPRFPRNRD